MAKKNSVVAKRKVARTSVKKVSKTAHMKSISTGMRPVLPTGWTTGSQGLALPPSRSAPLPAARLRTGLKEARRQIDESLDELLGIVAGPYYIDSIELQVSFSADGKFLGFGIGGATSLTLTIKPERNA